MKWEREETILKSQNRLVVVSPEEKESNFTISVVSFFHPSAEKATTRYE